MGWKLPPFYGKKNGREERKIAKINRKIANLEADKAIYQERIAKRQPKEEPKKIEVVD